MKAFLPVPMPAKIQSVPKINKNHKIALTTLIFIYLHFLYFFASIDQFVLWTRPNLNDNICRLYIVPSSNVTCKYMKDCVAKSLCTPSPPKSPHPCHPTCHLSFFPTCHILIIYSHNPTYNSPSTVLLFSPMFGLPNFNQAKDGF